MSPARTYFLVGQNCAALGAATGQNLAAIGGSHSLAEAVDLLGVQLLGLIGTFRSHVMRHLLSDLGCLSAALTRHLQSRRSNTNSNAISGAVLSIA